MSRRFLLCYTYPVVGPPRTPRRLKMITKLKIANVATYSPEGQELAPLKEVNFIYGANGVGKTTISRILANPTNGQDCEIVWKDGQELKAYVYNQDFVNENFMEDGNIKGVFTLGSDDIGLAEEIKKVREKLAEITREKLNLKHTLNGEDGNGGVENEIKNEREKFNSFCWEKIKTPWDAKFKDAFEGCRGSRESFADKVKREFPIRTTSSISQEELEEKARVVFAAKAEQIEALPLISFDDLEKILADSLFTKVIIGSQDLELGQFIRDLNLSDWVRKGQEKLTETSGICPFCQQSLPLDFESKLNQYFDNTYISDIATLDDLIIKWGEKWSQKYHMLKQIQSTGNPKLNVEQFNAALQLLESNVTIIKSKLSEKKQEPSRAIEFPSLQEAVSNIMNIISETNEAINAHNLLVQNQKEEKKQLPKKIWNFLVNKYEADLQIRLTQMDNLQKSKMGITEGIQKRIEEIRSLQNELQNLEKSQTSINPTVNAINGMLHSFGFEGFKLATASNTTYKLIRPSGENRVGKTLSEGEKSFVTFLYFWHLVTGSHSNIGVLEDRIVVFDDPVSSLDSQSFFTISTLIRQYIENVLNGEGNIKQIILLTHNVYFYKEVTFDWCKGKKRGKRDEKRTFWEIRKLNNISQIEKSDKNRIQTAYEQLWGEIRREDLSIVSLQNAMRRILEFYFKILGGVDFQNLEERFSGLDKSRFKSLFSWLNDGSHSVDDGLSYITNQSECSHFKSIFKSIFEYTGHISHYDMMMNKEDYP